MLCLIWAAFLGTKIRVTLIFSQRKQHPNQVMSTKMKIICSIIIRLRCHFGLILMAFEDAVKEGDGQRLYELYRLMLLIYKSKGHHKYAYVTLLQLVKLSALYSEFEAHRAKWNRGVNTTGGKGRNIPLDLLKEQKNLSIKTLWRNLGPNLNEFT